MNQKVIAIIQARMGSTRLPGKVLMNIKNKTVLNHVVDRVKQCKEIDEVIVATTTLSKDDLIVDELKKIGCKYYRGSQDNVLDRYYNTAKLYKGNIIIRITADCPLIDPKVIDQMIKYYINHDYSIVTNAGDNLANRTYPRGLDTEIFTFNLLEDAAKNANKPYQLEHVTPYIYENNTNTFYYKNPVDYSKYRLTLDTKEDFNLIKEIYENLYFGENNFYLDDIIQVMEKNPHLYYINSDIEQKKLDK